jgi:hypothetical protein
MNRSGEMRKRNGRSIRIARAFPLCVALTPSARPVSILGTGAAAAKYRVSTTQSARLPDHLRQAITESLIHTVVP